MNQEKPLEVVNGAGEVGTLDPKKPSTITKIAAPKKSGTRKAPAAAKTGEPNVIFVGKVETKDPKTSKRLVSDAEPPKSIQDGREKITLPDGKTQLKGFYHPKAAQIIRAMPKVYKSFRPKGAK